MSKSRSHYYLKNSYLAEVVRVIDGDTVHLRVDLGLRVWKEVYLRLEGIDAPEIRGEEKEEGMRSRDGLEMIFDGHESLGNCLTVTINKGKSFDRWIGTIYAHAPDAPDTRPINLSEAMVELGLAEQSLT